MACLRAAGACNDREATYDAHNAHELPCLQDVPDGCLSDLQELSELPFVPCMPDVRVSVDAIEQQVTVWPDTRYPACCRDRGRGWLLRVQEGCFWRQEEALRGPRAPRWALWSPTTGTPPPREPAVYRVPRSSVEVFACEILGGHCGVLRANGAAMG